MGKEKQARKVSEEEVQKAKELFRNLYGKEALAQFNKPIESAVNNMRATFAADPTMLDKMIKADKDALTAAKPAYDRILREEKNPALKRKNQTLRDKMDRVFRDVYLDQYLTKDYLDVYYKLQDDPNHKNSPYDIFFNSPDSLKLYYNFEERMANFNAEMKTRREELAKDSEKKAELDKLDMQLAVINNQAEKAKMFYPVIDYYAALAWTASQQQEMMKSGSDALVHPDLRGVSAAEMKEFVQEVGANHALVSYYMREMSNVATKMMWEIDPTFAERDDLGSRYEQTMAAMEKVRAEAVREGALKESQLKDTSAHKLSGTQPRFYMDGLTDVIVSKESISAENKALADQLFRPEIRGALAEIRKNLNSTKGMLKHTDSPEMAKLKRSVDEFLSITSVEEMEQFCLSNGGNAQTMLNKLGEMREAAGDYVGEKMKKGIPKTQMGNIRLKAAGQLFETLLKVESGIRGAREDGVWLGNAELDGGLLHKAARELSTNLGKESVDKTMETLQKDALDVNLDSPDRDAKLAQLLYVSAIKENKAISSKEKLTADAIREDVLAAGLAAIQRDPAFRAMMKQPKERLYPLIREDGGAGLHRHFLQIKAKGVASEMKNEGPNELRNGGPQSKPSNEKVPV